MVHPFNGAARKSLPPLDRSCVFHSCWLGVPLGADNAALFFLLSQVDYNLVQNLSWAPFAVPGSGPLPLLPQYLSPLPTLHHLAEKDGVSHTPCGQYVPAPGPQGTAGCNVV